LIHAQICDYSIYSTSLAGVDYTSVVTNITFNNGVDSTVFTVPIINDDVPETNETFEVFLKNIPDSPYKVIFDDPSVAVGTIVDDDTSPCKKLLLYYYCIAYYRN